tara:strand:- start:335 stop:922 length:588 start_codon:yes stop_codon:yes gene_type:complete
MKAICYFDRKLSPQRIYGTIQFSQSNPSSVVQIDIDIKNFKKNKTHAIHIHEFGNLTDGCHSTGTHFNPENHVHGLFHKKHHAGDIMSNLQTDSKNGSVHAKFFDSQISLFPGKCCVIGRSVVIHEYPDDLGNSAIYDDWKYKELKKFAVQRGYIKKNQNKSHSELLEKIKKESLLTGNAGGRMTCAIIGIDDDK